jgi:polyisoprenoid-binding protein YceI
MKQLPRVLVVTLALAVASQASAEIWTIDPAHTVAGFTARHMMITNVTGVFEAATGTIDYTPGNPGATKADITIEAKSINTRNARRDTHLKTDDFINVEKYPAITFKSKRVQNVRADGFDMVGDLTIRDVTKEVVLDGEYEGQIDDPYGNKRAGFTATTQISRSEFGVRWNHLIETGGAVVGDNVKITLHLEAIRQN